MRKREFQREIEAILNALRQWLMEVEDSSELDELTSDESALPEVDLHSMVSELTALRGEVRLGSRGSKASRETMAQAADTFKAGLENVHDELHASSEDMEHAADAFKAGLENVQTQLDASNEEAEKSLSQVLVPLVRERDHLRDEIRQVRDEPLRRGGEALLDALEGLRRGRMASEETNARLGWRAIFLPRDLFGGMLEGYDMASRKIEQTLNALGITEISCEGQDFDPNSMRAVETKERDDVPPGRVLEVVRPGYRRGDTILRVAEVRTATARKNRKTEE